MEIDVDGGIQSLEAGRLQKLAADTPIRWRERSLVTALS